MDKKYLFVGEYDDAYTGGSIVFISTKEYLSQIESNGLKVIQDLFNVQARKLMHLLNYDDNYAVTPEDLWKCVNENNFTDDFKDDLKTLLSKIGDNYPGYGDKKIRPDWMFNLKDGIYIVFELEVDSQEQDIFVISDTYYCA